MYHAHWGLERAPFSDADHPPVYHGGSQTECLLRLKYLVHQRRRAGIVLGEAGSGRTLLLTAFGELCRREGREVAMASLADTSADELCWRIATQWSVGCAPSDDLARKHRRIADFARATHLSGGHAVLLLDDADRAPAETLGQIVRLLNVEASHSWLTALAATTPQHAHQLGPELLNKIDLRIDLEGWDESDTAAFVQFAVFAAGGDRPLFDGPAIATLHQLSHGLPRRVKLLAEHALLVSAGRGIDQVDTAAVEAAYEEVHWSAGA